jgi:hypothetical protein
MHGAGEVDPLTPENKELLGLQDGEASANAINKESFVQDFQEINVILKDLNKEHDNLKKNPQAPKPQENKQIPPKKEQSSSNTGSSSSSNQKSNTGNKNAKKQDSSSSFNILAYFTSVINFFYSLGKYMAFDNSVGIAIMIVSAFIILNILKNLCSKKKKVKKVIQKDATGNTTPENMVS